DYESIYSLAHYYETGFQWYSSGEEAMRSTERCSRALWLISFQLPDMLSTRLLGILRRRPRRGAFILVGDFYSIDEELAARRSGATAYVCKPASAAWLKDYMPRSHSPSIRAGPTSEMPNSLRVQYR